MPRPQCQGMRPKRIDPNSVSTSAQARLARMLDTKPFCPTSGGSWFVARKPGASPGVSIGLPVDGGRL